MNRTSVLAIGIDPALAEPSSLGEFTPELVRAYIDAQIKRLSALGYDAETCLIDLGETAEKQVERALRSKFFGCIVLGAGLREPPERLILFERIINLIHALAPQSLIAFNTTPADTAEAVQRWLAAPINDVSDLTRSG